MTDVDPRSTQRDLVSDVPAELREAGFDDVAEVGRGGFGIVYRCVEPQLDRAVAVKVLTSYLDPDNLDRFFREQRAMGRLSGHPHIVTVLRAGTTAGGRPFIVMPYHARDSLETLLRNSGPLGWTETLRIGIKLAGALDAAHRAGTLHRDVKPANILMDDYGEPQLTDFGIARIAGGFQTSTGMITGSPAFTAPEVLEGASPTVVSDVYSLGATLFCAVTGHAAFERRSGEKVVAQFLRITSEPIPDLRGQGLPAELAAIIELAMARDPAERPPTAAAFGDELREVQRSHGVAVDEMVHPVESDGPPRIPTHTHPSQRTESRITPTPPTPATKYRPLVPTRSLVSRDRLLEMLQAGGRRRLMLLHAPSGFGKTTLAAQWREELTQAGVVVAWLTVDDDDNNEVWFLAHLLESIRRVRPSLAVPLGGVLEEHGNDAARYVLTTLVDEMHAADDRIVLVIDDWHRVSDTATVAALAFLLEHGCHHLQIIVTSWSRGCLPLGKLRIRDELLEIDGESLRFDADEARSLFNAVGGMQLDDADVQALVASTDGWAAGLQLAMLSLRGGVDVAGLVDRLVCANDVVEEFLAENVLDALDAETEEFMLATSITDRTCGALASALTGIPRGQAMLEDVEKRGLFLHRTDDDPQWFRYHHMFAEILHRRLERGGAERVEQLHRAAAIWFAERQHLSEAVDHALAAGDPAYAVDIVEQDETHLLEQSRMTSLLALVAKLPAALVVTRPRLQLTVAWAQILLQHTAPAYGALNRLDLAMGRAGLADSARADMKAEADVVRGVAEIFADRAGAVDELITEAMSRPETLPPRVPGVAGNIAAFAAIYRFEFEAAHRLLAWAAPYQDMLGPFASVYARLFGGIAARYQLDVPAAMTNFREAYEIGRSAGPHSHAMRLAAALLGELLYETGELAEAEGLVEESYQLGAEGGGVDWLAARYAIGARIKAARGDLSVAADRLSAGMAAAEQLRLPRLEAVINNERIRLGIGIAADVAARLRSARAIPQDDGIAMITAELDEDSGIRLLSASDSADDRAQACRRAAALAAGIDDGRRPLAALQAQLLLAETLVAVGRADEVSAAVPGATKRCGQLGLSQLLVDAGLI